MTDNKKYIFKNSNDNQNSDLNQLIEEKVSKGNGEV